MDIIKVIGVGIIGGVAALILRGTRSEYAPLAVIAAGIVILILTLNALSDVIVAFEEIVDKTNLDRSLFSSLLKIIGIGYLTEYSVSICNDLDCASIGKKIALAGKITIFLSAFPIIIALIRVIGALVS